MDAQCWQADTLITAVMNDTVSNGIIIPTQAYSYTHLHTIHKTNGNADITKVLLYNCIVYCVYAWAW